MHLKLLRPLLVLLMVAPGSLMGSGAVAASPTSTSAAFERRLAEAAEALKAGKLDVALEGFRRSSDLATDADQQWRAWLGEAVTQRARDKLAKALRLYARVLEASATSKEAHWLERRREVAGEAAKVEKEALARQIGILRVESNPAAADVTLYGAGATETSKPTTPATFYLAPGRYRLRLDLKAHKARDMDVSLKLGERKTVVLDLDPLPETKPDPIPEKKKRSPDPSTEDAEALWDLRVGAVAGTSGALLVAGITCHVLAWADAEAAFSARDRGDPDWPEIKQRGMNKEIAAWVLYGLAGAAAVSAVVLSVVRPDATDADAPSVSIGAGPQSVLLYGRF